MTSLRGRCNGRVDSPTMRDNRWIVVVALLLVLLLGGGGAYLVIKGDPPPAAGAKKPRKERPPRVPGSRSKSRDAGSNDNTGANSGSGDSTSTSVADGRRGRDAPLVPVPPVQPKPKSDGSGVAGGDVSGEVAGEADDGSPAAPLEVSGIVLDGADGTPIAGARILYALMEADGTPTGGWEGDTTNVEGRFKPNAWKAGSTKGKTGEIRVRAPGYSDFIGPVHEAEITVRLEKRDREPLPGSLRGTVLKPDGDPYEGRVQFEGSDAFGNNMGQWTETDASGGFMLAAVPSGTWRLRVGGGARMTVLVPDGGEAWASFKAGDGDVAAGKPRADTDRRVVVTLPADAEGAASVRAEVKERSFWRAPVSGGTAEFAHLPVGSYTFVIETPGKPERSLKASIEAGDDAQTVTFEK